MATSDYNWVISEFEASVPMSVYLVAILISDYQCITQTPDMGMSAAISSVCSRPNAADQLQFALNTSLKVLDFLEEYTRIPFALPKIGNF